MSSSAGLTPDQRETLANFQAVTQAATDTAVEVLESTNWNLEVCCNTCPYLMGLMWLPLGRTVNSAVELGAIRSSGLSNVPGEAALRQLSTPEAGADNPSRLSQRAVSAVYDPPSRPQVTPDDYDDNDPTDDEPLTHSERRPMMDTFGIDDSQVGQPNGPRRGGRRGSQSGGPVGGALWWVRQVSTSGARFEC